MTTTRNYCKLLRTEFPDAHLETFGDRIHVFTTQPHGVFERFVEKYQLKSVTIRNANLEDVFLKADRKEIERLKKLNDSPSRFKLPTLTYRVWKVWRRNFDVFMKTIHVNFLPSVLEPILYLVALGLGLGTFVTSIEGFSYIQFIAPALIAIAIMYGSFFECTYAFFRPHVFPKDF